MLKAHEMHKVNKRFLPTFWWVVSVEDQDLAPRHVLLLHRLVKRLALRVRHVSAASSLVAHVVPGALAVIQAAKSGSWVFWRQATCHYACRCWLFLGGPQSELHPCREPSSGLPVSRTEDAETPA